MALCLAFVASGRAEGQQPPSGGDTKQDDAREIGIVLRISDQLFEELTRDTVTSAFPVRRNVDGRMVYGDAVGEGTTSVRLEVSDSDADAEIIVAVKGTTNARLYSRVGPVTVHFSTRGQFDSELRLHFDGIRYHADPATSTSRNCSTVDRVCARRRGPVGKLVERVGGRMADNAIAEVNEVIEDVSVEILNETFDEAAVELVAELNQTTEFEKQIAKYFPETANWMYHLDTHEHYIVAGIAPPEAEFPAIFDQQDEHPHALLEMWLKTTPGEAAMLQMMADWGIAYDLLKGFVPEEDREELADEVKLIRRGEWSVIQIGLPKADTTSQP